MVSVTISLQQESSGLREAVTRHVYHMKPSPGTYSHWILVPWRNLLAVALVILKQVTQKNSFVKWNSLNYSSIIIDVDGSCNGIWIHTGLGVTFRTLFSTGNMTSLVSTQTPQIFSMLNFKGEQNTREGGLNCVFQNCFASEKQLQSLIS